jgi:ABC-type lipoprotein release transport system permease subunit
MVSPTGWTLVAGIATGLPLALIASDRMAAFLLTISPRDPATYGLVAATSLLTGMAAVLLPAWRGSLVDPASALREDGRS